MGAKEEAQRGRKENEGRGRKEKQKGGKEKLCDEVSGLCSGTDVISGENVPL